VFSVVVVGFQKEVEIGRLLSL